jgi:general nucleoside transport system permease protein
MIFLISLGLFLQVAVQMGTHILLGTLGGIMFEKAGNTNLGIEGMMLMGASIGYYAGIKTGNPALAVLCAGFAGSVGALIYSFITVTLCGNQVVTGLVLTIFGTGVAGFLGKRLSSQPLSVSVTGVFTHRAVPVLSKIPVIGPMLFDQSPYIYMSVIIAVLLYLYYRYSRWGLNIRAVGENPAAADASGINVSLYKYMNISCGGFLCGLGGAYLSLVFVPRWQENITAGAGWIAVALVIFSMWNPIKAVFAAWAFGALKGLSFKCQNLLVAGHAVIIPPRLLDMIPYVATIIVLVIMSFRMRRENQSPASLGNAYFREER